ncbi:hypothetical protein H072_954 [Dactylellina haptotyla CBS 200.50]|uniref:peptidyl-tRNA hydrolase n=1 Tax=Dactylellina haptotyla (strain CBS 200.50) TaxID=1284197 RepID=S8BZX8_DACHA|nr:hypothetical protein H072_954 [Dactylellina haptotyla CBS 200.50]
MIRLDFPPNFLLALLVTVVASGLGGYIIGSSTTRIRDLPAPPPAALSKSKPSSASLKDSFENISAGEAEEEEEEEEDSDNDAMIQSDYSHFGASALSEECKLVLCVRTDLGMTKGKMAAQCGHATLACYKAVSRHAPLLLKRWESTGQAKIALKVDSEEELLTLQAQAMSLGLVAKVVHDAGRTQIAAGSSTVLGIGPAPKSVINQITGHLKLL